MIFLFKPITPGKLRVDAIRLALLSAIHETERGVMKDWKLITDTWEHEVVWESTISLKGGPSVSVGSGDQILRWLNDGTEPHMIRSKKSKGHLKFQSGFIPKTIPNFIGSQDGGKFGPSVMRPVVRHPGFEARNYEKVMKDKWEIEFRNICKKWLDRAARMSGHGV